MFVTKVDDAIAHQTKSVDINELAKAMCNVQASIGGALKDTSNPFFKSKYADLESVWESCRKQLTDNGLCVVQTTSSSDDAVVVDTHLIHVSGQFISGQLKMKPVKNDPQGIGSCITYARRYALAAMIGIYQTDDDGNAASGNGTDDKPAPVKDNDSPVASQKQIDLLKFKLKKAGKTIPQLESQFGFFVDKFPRGKVNEAITWIEGEDETLF